MKEEPKPIVKKVLESGLVDRATTAMLEQMGMLPSGSVDLVQENRLKDATEKVVSNIADELATAIEKEHAIRETALDLNRIRWPAYITISNPEGPRLRPITEDLSVMMDQMGRYYIRISDATEAWFVPGFVIQRQLDSRRVSNEYITEAQKLYVGDKAICFQIATKVLGVEEKT